MKGCLQVAHPVHPPKFPPSQITVHPGSYPGASAPHHQRRKKCFAGFYWLSSIILLGRSSWDPEAQAHHLPVIHMMETLQAPNESQLKKNSFMQPLVKACLGLWRNQTSDPYGVLPKEPWARVITSSLSHDSCLVGELMVPLCNSEK